MESVALVADKVKGAVNSTRDFITVSYKRHSAEISRRNPIEILKRLQREAFSDLMKLRDRQDKVERFISYYNKSSKASPFQEANTRVRGEVDMLGAVLVASNVDQQAEDVLDGTGFRNGINSKFTFETIIRQKGTLKTELVASHSDWGFIGEDIGSPLRLSKISYAEQVTDCLFANVIPVGAQCRDIGNMYDTNFQAKSFMDILEPPLMAQHCGGGIGVTANKSNLTATLAQFVSGMQKIPRSISLGHCLGTFGKISYQVSHVTKLSVSGLLQVSKSSQDISLGPLTIPLRTSQHTETPYTSMELLSSPTTTELETDPNSSLGSVALSLESQLDECSRIGGWIEMQNAGPKNLKWAVSLSDTPPNDMGWGLRIGGTAESRNIWDQFQIEASLKLNIGETQKFSLQPGFVYIKNGTSHVPAIVLRTHCAL